MPTRSGSGGPRPGRTAGHSRPARPRRPLPPRTGVQPPRAIVRRSTESWALQSALERHGLGPVVGVDEAGRGACAGPLAVAACILRPGDARRLEGLTDSKALTAAEREEYDRAIRRRAVDWCVVLVDPREVDRRGVHAANIDGMRRAVARLDVRPGYVLTDGFPVSGFGVPALAVPKGDLAAACVAAASVLAKVARDRLMTELHEHWPQYGFDGHKGYCTPSHTAALAEHGPCADHRFSFVNVAAVAGRTGVPGAGAPPDGDPGSTFGVVRHNGALVAPSEDDAVEDDDVEGADEWVVDEVDALDAAVTGVADGGVVVDDLREGGDTR